MKQVYDTRGSTLTLKVGEEKVVTVEDTQKEVPVTNDPDGVFKMFFTEFVGQNEGRIERNK